MTVDLNRLHNLAETARCRAEAMAPSQHGRSGNRSWYRIENAAANTDMPASIYLYDAIGEWGITAADFVNDLRGVKAQAIDLHVNCEGGEVFDGLAIYETLCRHPADITAYVDGIAASSASFVVQAAKKIVMAKRGRMMIHDAHGFVMGNARDMRETAQLLDDLSDTIADIYAERSGGTRAEWRKAMAAGEGGPDGTWYDAATAVKAGLADEVQGGDAPAGRATTPVEAQQPAAVADAEPLPLWQTEPVVNGAGVAIWDAGAFLATLDEISNPPAVLVPPDGQALRTMFDLP